MEPNVKTMGIGAIARQAAVSIDTVRYYEKNGLLHPAARAPSGYRRYEAIQLSRLRFIRRAQQLGFTLKDIRELLGISAQRDVARVRRAAERKLVEVEERIAALQAIQRGLSEMIAQCPGHGRAADCPILKALGGGSTS